MRSLLIILVFGILPVAVIHYALDQVETLEVDKLLLEIRKKHEKILPKVRESDNDLLMICRSIATVAARLDYLSETGRQLQLQRLRTLFPEQITLFCFDTRGKFLPKYSDLPTRGRTFSEMVLKLLEKGSLLATPPEGQLEKDLEKYLNPFCQSSAGKRAHAYKGRPMMLGQRPDSSHILWDSFMISSATARLTNQKEAEEETAAVAVPDTKNAVDTPKTPRTIGGYIAFIHRGQITQLRALQSTISHINLRAKSFQTGYFDATGGIPGSFPEHYFDDKTFRTPFLAALSKFDNSFVTENAIITIMVRKNNSYYFVISPLPFFFNSRTWLVFYLLSTIWVIAIISQVPKFQSGLSIRIPTKLIALFLFAVGIPSLILLTFGYYALKDQNRILMSDLEQRLLSMLSQFDERFPEEKERFREMLRRHAEQAGKAASFDERAKVYDTIWQDQFVHYIAATPKRSGSDPYVRKMPFTSVEIGAFLQIMGRAILTQVLGSDQEPAAEDGSQGNLVETFRDEEMGRMLTISFSYTPERLLENIGLVENLKIPKDHFYYVYNDIIGDNSASSPAQLLMVLSLGSDLEKRYCMRTFSDLRKTDGITFNVAALCEDVKKSRVTWPNDDPLFIEVQPQVTALAHQSRVKRTAAQILPFRGEDHLWVALRGVNLERQVLVAWTPLTPLIETTNRKWLALVLVALLIFFATGVVGLLLSEQILRPIVDLRYGIQAIGRRDFSHQVPVHSGDELGQMSVLLNQTIVGLGELEIARIVQESLFPREALSLGDFRIAGLSRAMTDVGGDYYDFFMPTRHSCLALIGDVSGHGVSAALVMGIAKGVLAFEGAAEKPLIEILESFNSFLLDTVKRSNMMMTLFILKLEEGSDTLLFANGGHNYPLFLERSTLTVGQIQEKMISPPLGILKKPKYRSYQRIMTTGDMVLLFTDGIIEAQTASSEQIGEQRLRRWFQECAALAPEEAVQHLSKRFQQATENAPAQDDITLVCLKRA